MAAAALEALERAGRGIFFDSVSRQKVSGRTDEQ